MATLLDIRALVEQEIKMPIENADVVNWSNQVNMEVGTQINVPSSTPASIVLTTDLSYDLPEDLKIINRIRLQSDIDNGIDRDIDLGYRIYSGKIILPRTFWLMPDTLIIDYYKDMTYFTDVGDSIDIADRFSTLYASYILWRYFDSPSAMQSMGAEARRRSDLMQAMYQNMKTQVISYYSLGDQPVVLQGRW